jgi:hypothetical protein
MRRIMTAEILLLSVAIAGCSTGAFQHSSASSTASARATTDRVAQPKKTVTIATSGELVRALNRRVGRIRVIKTYTAANDPNDLLGRPGGYSSKTAFADSRVKSADRDTSEKDAIINGGSVEVYSTPSGAKKRAKYLRGILDGSNIFGTEYDYVSGTALLRLSQALTPAQARTYQKVWLAVVTDHLS